MVLVAVSFSLQITVSAQTTYITVYGQLTQFQCPGSTVSGPCTGFSLTTNGTTPGIPNYPMLDFSQSVVPAPTQSDVGKLIIVTGYYGQESPCTIVNSCPAFFVHIWGPHYGQFNLPTTTGCFSSSNPPTTWYSVQCATAPTMPLGNSYTTNSQVISGFSQSMGYVIVTLLVVFIVYFAYRRDLLQKFH